MRNIKILFVTKKENKTESKAVNWFIFMSHLLVSGSQNSLPVDMEEYKVHCPVF